MYRATATIILILALTGCGMVPERKRQPSRTATQTYNPSPSARQCLAELGKTNASFTPLPDQYYGSGCSTLNTVRLSAIYGDERSLPVANLGPVACPLANTFAAWARYGVDRAARQILGSGLARIETMGS